MACVARARSRPLLPRKKSYRACCFHAAKEVSPACALAAASVHQSGSDHDVRVADCLRRQAITQSWDKGGGTTVLHSHGCGTASRCPNRECWIARRAGARSPNRPDHPSGFTKAVSRHKPLDQPSGRTMRCRRLIRSRNSGFKNRSLIPVSSQESCACLCHRPASCAVAHVGGLFLGMLAFPARARALRGRLNVHRVTKLANLANLMAFP